MGRLGCSRKKSGGGAEYRVWVEREWWGVWSLGSISSTPGEHCIEYSRGELGNDVRGGAVHVIFCDGASKNNATGESGYKVDLLMLKMCLECARLPIRVRECARPFSFVSATRAWSARVSPFVSVSTLLYTLALVDLLLSRCGWHIVWAVRKIWPQNSAQSRIKRVNLCIGLTLVRLQQEQVLLIFNTISGLTPQQTDHNLLTQTALFDMAHLGLTRVRLAFGRHPMHPPTPDDASRIQNIHKTPTQLPTYNNASRTHRTPPTPDDASRMQYSHKTRATSPGPGPIYII